MQAVFSLCIPKIISAQVLKLKAKIHALEENNGEKKSTRPPAHFFLDMKHLYAIEHPPIHYRLPWRNLFAPPAPAAAPPPSSPYTPQLSSPRSMSRDSEKVLALSVNSACIRSNSASFFSSRRCTSRQSVLAVSNEDRSVVSVRVSCSASGRCSFRSISDRVKLSCRIRGWPPRARRFCTQYANTCSMTSAGICVIVRQKGCVCCQR